MVKVMIAPLDAARRTRLLRAVADRGKASGIEAAAKIVAEMANHKGRVVGTTALRDLAALLADKARDIRTAADAEVKALEVETKV